MLDFLSKNYNYNTFGIGVLDSNISNFTYELRFSNSPRFREQGLNWENWKTENIFPTYEKLGPRDKSSNFGGEPGKISFKEIIFILLKNLLLSVIRLLYRRIFKSSESD